MKNEKMNISVNEAEILGEELNDEVLSGVSGGFTFKAKHIGTLAGIGGIMGIGIGLIYGVVKLFIPQNAE